MCIQPQLDPACGVAASPRRSEPTSVGHDGLRTWIAATLWAVAVVLALSGLTRYGNSAGALAAPAPTARTESQPATDRFTLVVAVHPMCPCTRASLTELEGVLARCAGRLETRLLVFTPRRADVMHWDYDMIDALRNRFATAEVRADPDGTAAAALGCQTSGSVVLFDPSGEPCFWGGITAGRGHVGDNAGVETIVSTVLNGFRPTGQTPVYGCPLVTPDPPADGGSEGGPQ